MFTVLYDTVYIDSVLNENDEQFDEWVNTFSHLKHPLLSYFYILFYKTS